jgi:hypothetical protein
VNTIVTRRPRTSYGNSQTLLYLDVPSRALARPFDSTREISFATDGFSATFNTRAPIAPRALWRCIALARYARLLRSSRASSAESRVERAKHRVVECGPEHLALGSASAPRATFASTRARERDAARAWCDG